MVNNMFCVNNIKTNCIVTIMCGIWAYLLHHQGQFNNETVKDCMSIEGRGPDDFHVSYYKNKYAIGFHRLSIMDPSFKGSQPFTFIKNNVKYVKDVLDF